jgi:hypothetical protein
MVSAALTGGKDNLKDIRCQPLLTMPGVNPCSEGYAAAHCARLAACAGTDLF